VYEVLIYQISSILKYGFSNVVALEAENIN